ncbi:MAG TPA: Uma2 family endonuclease [Hyphomicrobiaceae bacterium]|nr:Uma2 family endonuclease [Hyphomicrobiaceae bacterium]
MDPSPTNWHQRIVGNLVSALDAACDVANPIWIAIPGTGTRVPASSFSLPQPDVMVVPALTETATPVSDDALAISEVLSRSNTESDQPWRRQVYASVPSCRHYVTIDSRNVAVERFDRASEWKRTAHLALLDDALALDGLGITPRIADLYR